MGMESPKLYTAVGGKIALSCTGLQTTPFHGCQHSAENGDLRKFGSTYPHGTAFPIKQCLYQKEATGMERPKMHSSSRCKNRTYQNGAGNQPVSCGAA